jgi:hypothetical protein
MSGFGAFGATPDSIAGDSVSYFADRIIYDIDRQAIMLIGNSRIDFQGMTLTAHQIDFLMERDLVFAEGLTDSTQSDSVIGMPRFTSGTESFVGTKLSYDLRERRGVVEGGSSSSPEGVYYGAVVKRAGEEHLDVKDGVFTTCEREHPHYSFRSAKMRIMVDDRVVSQPVVMEIADTPVLWLPFGVFFIDKDRRSGFLSPRMGENVLRGRYMDQFGYYLAPNDYYGLQTVISLDERNGYAWTLGSAYALKYRFNGSARYDLSDDWSDVGTRRWQLNWRHKQKLGPRSDANADINYISSDTRSQTSSLTQSSLYEQFRSSIGYSRSWDTGYSLSVRGTMDKNLQTGQMTQVLPNMSARSGQQYFFEQPRPRGPRAPRTREEPDWWRRLGYNWSWSGTNTVTRAADVNSIYDQWEFREQVADSSIRYLLTLSRSGYGVLHDGVYDVVREADSGTRTHLTSGLIYNVSGTTDTVRFVSELSLDSSRAELSGDLSTLTARLPEYQDDITWSRAKVPSDAVQNTSQSVRLSLPLPTPRWLNVAPSARWNATWYSDPRRVAGGDSANTTHNLSAGVNTSATAYGTYPVGIGPVTAFRHVVTPSASMSYNIRRYDRGGTYVLGGREVSGDTTRVVTLGLRNTLQMKGIWGGEEYKLARLVTLNSGLTYRMDADGRKWSDPRTSVVIEPSRLFNTNISMVHSFYHTDTTSAGQVVDTGFDWRDPRLMSFSVNSKLNLAGGERDPNREGDEGFVGQRQSRFRERSSSDDLFDPATSLSTAPGDGRIPDWNPGWSLNLRHSYRWERPRLGESFRREPSNALDLATTVTPWEGWEVRYTTHYDITKRDRTGDSMDITRRLHCWQAQLNWTMTGPLRGYYFKIFVTGLPDVKAEAASANRSAWGN